MDMEIDVSERIVQRQAVVGVSWTTVTPASGAILPVVTTEQRVRVFNVSARARGLSVTDGACGRPRAGAARSDERRDS